MKMDFSTANELDAEVKSGKVFMFVNHSIFYKLWSVRTETVVNLFVPATWKSWMKDFLLFQSLSYAVSYAVAALRSYPKGMPYDYSFPVVQEFINRQLCSTCGLNLASLKELASHKKLHKENEEQSQRNENDLPPPQEPRWRPQRIAARRQRELLCAFQFQ